MRIGQQLIEVPMIHEGISEDHAWARAGRGARRETARPRAHYEILSSPAIGEATTGIVIAMVRMSEPLLLILDELTTALDVTVEAAVVELVKDLGKTYGTSMLFICHNLGLVLEICDRICVMYSGEAVEIGSIKDVFDKLQHPYTGAFPAAPLPGANKSNHLLKAIPGNFSLPHDRPDGCNFGLCRDYFQGGQCDGTTTPMAASIEIEATPPGKVVLKVDNLKKYYEVAANALFDESGGMRAVKANETLNFEVRESETLAIVGESGCGKSTFAKVLMGLKTATEGAILLDHRNIKQTRVENRNTQALADVQMVFQNPSDMLNPSMTVGHQIMCAFEIFGVGKTEQGRRDEMMRLLDLVKLPREFGDRMPRQLSGGQKQWVGIARAFAGGARIVMADEPVSALDVSVQAAVTDLLMEIQRNQKTTLLFISHDLSIVRYLSDRVMVMYLGHVVEIGTTD